MQNKAHKLSEHHRQHTTIPVHSSPAYEELENPITPAFIRFPAERERCPYTGLSRGYMSRLVLGDDPPVKSVALRMTEGAKRGIRLIHLPSLLAYLHREMADQLDKASANSNPNNTTDNATDNTTNETDETEKK